MTTYLLGSSDYREIFEIRFVQPCFYRKGSRTRDLSQDYLGLVTAAAARKISHDSHKQTNLRGNRDSSVQECLSNLAPHKHSQASVVAH